MKPIMPQDDEIVIASDWEIEYKAANAYLPRQNADFHLRRENGADISLPEFEWQRPPRRCAHSISLLAQLCMG